MIRFVLVFLAVLVVLFTAELTHPVQNAIVLPWTSLLATTSAAVVSLFDSSVMSYGKVLQHANTGMGVSIEAGCNGIEASLILIAAVLAYPASWFMRLLGIILGFLAIQIVNVLRVVTLFYLVEYSTTMFEFAHLYLWQALIMLDVLVVWLLWVRQVARREARAEVVHAPAQ
ncbi:exosortase H [Rhodoferax sp.]|uniref:exosortase H n=1 Tax=Rhodoferax sp. TaxID=50421 RepID=UPI0026341B33|nr:exosortase H [Rhodoferax sp.]MDD2925649.1 exosortase H [Rhodoferax sp.]